MGAETLSEILKHFSLIANGSSSIAKLFAWIGITLIAIVILYYVFVGLVKLFKAFWRLNVKYLGFVLLMLGIVFITIALVIP